MLGIVAPGLGSFVVCPIADRNTKASSIANGIDTKIAGLPAGDVTVSVAWSTLNYKDGLAITGKSPVVRRFPMVPGIDFAGTVTASTHPAWKPGDRVVLNGWGVGETHCGGLAEVARVKGDWLVALPSDIGPGTLLYRSDLLARLGETRPAALIFPLTVCLGKGNPERAEAARELLTWLRVRNQRIEKDAKMVSTELIRVAILWPELWRDAIEDAFSFVREDCTLHVIPPVASVAEFADLIE